MRFGVSLPLILSLCFASDIAIAQQESVCFGTTGNGRLEHGWQLPASGDNFSGYSRLGVALGRNYVHNKVYAAVVTAYQLLGKNAPDKYYVYGESGWANGGKFRPHKTHQNGLSVDFFVPVLNSQGESVALPTNLFNKFGYGIEFNPSGKFDGYTIDFEAMADHLLALKQASDKEGIKIRHIIFDNGLQKLLHQTSRSQQLFAAVTFSKKKPWIRHDEHYHVDFIVPCKENT